MRFLYPNRLLNGTQNTQKPHILLAYPACNGRHVRCGIRQSIPSSNIAS